MGFLGTHWPRLDDKGRLALPARFRDALADGVVITKGQDKCLYVFPIEAWEQATDAAVAGEGDAAMSRATARVLFSSASDEVPDKQGRVVIPQVLRDYAGLDRDCAVIGARTRVEIWDRARWEAYLEEQDPAFSANKGEVLPGLT